jgi:hypothetical protein
MKTDHDKPLNRVLQRVDERRRGFLRKLLTGGAVVTAIPALAASAVGA